ncbi:cytochrome c oxidase subunit 8A, mitochondrial-like [Syngnathoides biaculeatus]|uniref:cytochrome c oxidase subunit 8A, mitochondrial-like n=1 Tax=Syngnathoides biaculeatus TaxID=300417 RepID=UPI002ADDAEE2|nr:cytochrome c oxidase subunit 8A, mitochondrial-like [Syngnathoides biaculeatus]
MSGQNVISSSVDAEAHPRSSRPLGLYASGDELIPDRALAGVTTAMKKLASRVPAKSGVAFVHAKPPRQRIGAAQSFLVLSAFAVAMLAPAAWIVRHLPEYRRRSRRKPSG